MSWTPGIPGCRAGAGGSQWEGVDVCVAGQCVTRTIDSKLHSNETRTIRSTVYGILGKEPWSENTQLPGLRGRSQ